MYFAMAFKRFLKISDYMSKISAMKLPVFIMDTQYCSQRNEYAQFGWVVLPSQKHWMTTSKRVQDRSKRKRVHDLEIATEKWKITSKVLFLLEVLNQQPEQIIPLRSLEQYRRQINLPKPHKISDFLRKSPKLFELYKDHSGVIWCGMTKEAEDLVQEEMKILDGKHQEKVVEYVTRFLMMSMDKRLPLDKIAHFRRDLGLPYDFRINWVHKHPKHFRVVKSEDDVEYLELTSWNPAWAVTELEKKVNGVVSNPPTPGVLSLPFPMKFPSNYKKIFRYGGQIEHFQKRSYLSPYADAQGLKAGSQEFDKRAVAIMHELLSFTIEKRLVTDHLTHFRMEFLMPQKLMRLLLKHFGIFYVSERGKRLGVFLTEAYEGPELIDTCPLVLWKEKVQSLIGYRGRKRRIETFSEFSDMEGEKSLFKEGERMDDAFKELEDDGSTEHIENLSLADDSEMDLGDIFTVYNNPKTS